MNNQPVATSMRYTKYQHQPIEWTGPGLYKWNGELNLWTRLPDEAVLLWIRDPSSRLGLIKTFAPIETTSEI